MKKIHWYKVISQLLIVVLLSFSVQAIEESPKDDTLTVIFKRKSVRKYLNKPIEKKDIETLIKAGMAAPTAGDKRPWAFIGIMEKEKLLSLAEGLPHGKMLENAGAAIVVCGIPSESFPGKLADFWIQDCSAATENILLAAEAIGLGAVWIGVYPGEERMEVLRKNLALPEGVLPLNIISIGYPTGEEKPKDKYNPAKIHWTQW